ncbi:DUF2489 domain-containing protein [Paraglaciecola aestuariivivens]
MIKTLLLLAAILIIAALSFYAGSLLFKLRNQNRLRALKTQKRIANITESIQTIASAVDQQQCNLSEGCIRIFHLLESLPVINKPDFSLQFKGVYQLYQEVKSLPTHEARKQQTKAERFKQDLHREALEAELETQILADMQRLKSFDIQALV